MKPSELAAFLDRLVRHRLKLSTMIWGPPGIGKSSIVAQTAAAHRLRFIDVRLSQLAPTDLRGLPLRSWVMASYLHKVGLDITSAVGTAAATEFHAYTALYHSLPDLAQILRGEGDGVAFPTEPSMRYATVVGLLTRAEDPPTGYHAFRWMTQTAPIEWVQLCATDLFRLMRARQKIKQLHEVLHAALLHVTRRAGRHAQIWNAAADIVINGMIVQEGYQLPEGGLRDQFLERLSTEQVYEILLKKEQPPPPVPMNDLLEGPPEDSTSSQDQAGVGQGQAGSEQKPGAPKAGGGEGKEPKEALEGHWRNALEQAQMAAKTLAAGKMPAGIQREMPSVIAAQLDWRTYLWRYLTQTPTDFQDFDRRFVGQRMYLDSLTGESVQVLVCVDTSGSVDNNEMQTFIGEVREILRAYPHLRCELHYADAALYGPYPLKSNSVIPPPQGGGGTDFRPFFDHIATHPFLWGKTVAIYLTDGYGDFPERWLKCPVLWVVTPGGLDLDRFPFGEAIRLLRSQPTPFVAMR